MFPFTKEKNVKYILTSLYIYSDSCNSSKNGHILCNDFLNKRVNKCTFEFTLNLQRFYSNLNKKIFVDLFMKRYLNVFLNIVNLIL